MAAEHDLFHHVRDSAVWEFFKSLGWELEMPKLFDVPHSPFLGMDGPQGYGVYFTKFMALEAIVVLLLLLILWPIGRRARSAVRQGRPWLPAGAFANFIEAVLLFIRDEIAREAIQKPHHDHDEEEHGGHGDEREHERHAAGNGHEPHPADRFVPYLSTAFWFILFCNLIGLVPFGGSPTGALGCTGALALCTLSLGFYAAARENGLHLVEAFIPPIESPLVMRLPLQAMMFVIEIIGLLIRHGVLAVRLFANMMGGHTVLAVLLGFAVMEKVLANTLLWALVSVGSVLGAVGVSLLEVLVAFIQAYIFTFLSAIYIGMLVYPEH